MGFLFWKAKEKGRHEVLSWNLMVAATDPDLCWKIASTFRTTSIPGNALTCETSFLMGSIVRDVIRAAFTDERQRQSIMSAESAYYKTFDDQSEDELPEGMKAVYGGIRLGHVARIALAAYGEENDFLPTTSSIFIHRIKGDPRMKYEVTPIFEEHRRSMMATLQ